MALNNIEQLLEKYDNAETSLKEEQELKAYFSKGEVASHLEVYKPLFNSFVDNETEQFTKSLPLKANSNSSYKWLAIAAVAVVLVSLFFINPFKTSTDDYVMTAQEEVDYKNAKQALGLIASHYKKGVSQVSYINVINQAGTQVEYLKEMDDPMGRIFK